MGLLKDPFSEHYNSKSLTEYMKGINAEALMDK